MTWQDTYQLVEAAHHLAVTHMHFEGSGLGEDDCQTTIWCDSCKAHAGAGERLVHAPKCLVFAVLSLTIPAFAERALLAANSPCSPWEPMAGRSVWGAIAKENPAERVIEYAQVEQSLLKAAEEVALDGDAYFPPSNAFEAIRLTHEEAAERNFKGGGER